MERLFPMQPLIEAVLDNRDGVKSVLSEVDEAAFIVDAMSAPNHAQRLDENRELGRTVSIVLTNDEEWEGHLIEGP